MNIAIINTLPIPIGEASVNRILSYAKGLVKEGNKVSILSSGKSNIEQGNIDGVDFACMGKYGNIHALISIIRILWISNFNYVIIVSNSLSLIYPIALICKLKKIVLLQEKSEYPFVLLKKGTFNSLYAAFYVNTTYKLFDGLIIMTKPLMNYFKTKVTNKCQLFEMPMTVDTDRFTISKSNSKYGDYIAYCGNMAGNKDGVINLIESFNIASKSIQNIKLVLIGDSTNTKDFENIKAFANSLNNANIIFYGRASRDEIPILLVNAKALALARPSSLQSTGGFPTKLGEYLSTGNPVIVTRVGDIPNYLNDTNAFTVRPDDNMAFAKAIIDVFSNYDDAQKRALAGKELANGVFNSKVQAFKLNKFLQSLI